MTGLFGEKYFGFIASAYGITFLVLAGLIIWSLALHRHCRRDLARLEEQGLRRARSRRSKSEAAS